VTVNDALLLRIVLVVVGYLAGSIPFGVIAARLSGGTDPRSVGSGRTGGTNALRALGRKWAAFVVTGDLAKGALPVLLARIATSGDSTAEVLVAAAAVIGSARSIFLGFHGGRGVGTGVGTMLVIQPLAVVISAPVFFLAILITRYVSLGSLLGSAAMFPAMLLIWAVATGLGPARVPALGRCRPGPDLDRPRRQHRAPPQGPGAQVRPEPPRRPRPRDLKRAHPP